MPMPPGIYSGRGKAQRTGDLPLGQGFDWTRTVAAQKEAAREEQLRAASSRPDSFQTLQQFEWLPQHGRTRPIRQYPPSSFTAVFGPVAASQGLDQWGSTTSLLTGGEGTVATAPSRRFHQQQYAHVLTPAGIRRAKAVERRPVSPLRSVNGDQGIWE
ncbi:hypothetical protein JL722_4164 [Aureococcus anophagefferens]|nr:hypothetical protein JL722_4164 [Aureococcus anophagefferens]